MLDGFKSASWPAKLVVIFVAGALLGLGLCGVGASLGKNFGIGLLIAGAISFWVSALGLVVALILLMIFGLKDKDR
jgi:hypothetical protein